MTARTETDTPPGAVRQPAPQRTGALPSAEPSRPRLVVLSSEVLDESASTRVPAVTARMRALVAAAGERGWEVVVLARSADGRRRHALFGDAPLVLLPARPPTLRRPAHRAGPASLRRRRALRDLGALNRWAATRAQRWHDLAHRDPRTAAAVPLTVGVRRALWQTVEAVRQEQVRARRRASRGGVPGWTPQLLALDTAFGPLLERLRPDVVHACGLPSAAVAAHAAERLRRAGHRCRWVYEPRRAAGAHSATEHELLHRADAVVAETTARAGGLVAEHGLPIAPPALPATELPHRYAELRGAQPPLPRPDAAGRRCAPRRPQPPADAPAPRWRPLDATPVRLGLGPANHAGQLAELAGAVCAGREDVSAEVFTTKPREKVIHPVDVHLSPADCHRPDAQLDQLRRVFGGYTHLLADAFRPVLGRLNGPHLEDDLPDLLRSRLRVALLARGSEARHPARHLARHGEDSLFHEASGEVHRRLTRLAERNHRVAVESGLPLFATTPDLLAHLPPGAVWLPLVVEVAAFAGGYPVMKRARPVVVHAPSARWTKGTERIVPTLEELDRRGHLSFELLEGVTRAEVRERVRRADIVLDQFTIGSYGNFACEGMAAGKPVLAYLDETTPHVVGAQVPIVNTRAGQVRSALEALLDDREEAIRIGAASRKFAEDHHDGRRTAAALVDFLGPQRE